MIVVDFHHLVPSEISAVEKRPSSCRRVILALQHPPSVCERDRERARERKRERESEKQGARKRERARAEAPPCVQQQVGSPVMRGGCRSAENSQHGNAAEVTKTPKP